MLDAAVLGRVGFDLYPNESETPLSEVRSFTRLVGGFAGNVATGLARLGANAAIVSRVGPDAHGDFIRKWLSGEGVDVRFLATDPYWLTPPTFCELWPPDRFPLTFYRRPTAPDWQLSSQDVAHEEIATARLLYATGTALAQSPSRETTLGTLASHQGTAIFDLDWRPTLWDDQDAYSDLCTEAVSWADVVIGNEEEVAAAGVDPPTLIVKLGERGALVIEAGTETMIPAFPVEVVNGLGAGDAFAAAVGRGLLDGTPLNQAARLGTIAGALVASRLGCAEAMPRRDELDAALRKALR